MVSDSLIPFSSISAPMLWICTVFGVSLVNSTFLLCGMSCELRSVLTRVDFPRPDSPTVGRVRIRARFGRWLTKCAAKLTNNHKSKLKSSFNCFSVNLVGIVWEPDEALWNSLQNLLSIVWAQLLKRREIVRSISNVSWHALTQDHVPAEFALLV